MASAEDMRVLLGRIGGMEQALLVQAREDQATAALQAMQQQQQQSAATAQRAQYWAAAAPPVGNGASAVVDTRLLGRPVAFDGRETSWRSFKFQFVAHCGVTDSRNAQHPHGPGHASSQCSAVLHADHGVPGGCAEGVGARG